VLAQAQATSGRFVTGRAAHVPSIARRSAALVCCRLPRAERRPGARMPTKYTKKASAIAFEKERLERELAWRVDELEREREYIRTVVNSTPALFCLIDSNLRIVRYNDAFVNLLGVGGQSARGELFCDAFVAPGEAAEVRRRLTDDDDEREHESAFRRADGSDAIVAWSKRKVTYFDGRPCIFLSGVDVTTKRAEREQLRASRARVVQAADAARHRIERDLHDGAQQRLVSISLALRLVRKAVAAGRAAAATKQLDEISNELDEAVNELRELARGIHPSVLTDRGLPDALETLAVRSAVPVEIERAPSERMNPQIEAAVYYVVAEALTNVTKYARARVASVRVFKEDGYLVTEVEDDGVGGAEAANGSGIRGLADRVEAVDGQLSIQSPRGGPTILRARIPIQPTP
jgi:PAS domain S-box-containing protein